MASLKLKKTNTPCIGVDSTRQIYFVSLGLQLLLHLKCAGQFGKWSKECRATWPDTLCSICRTGLRISSAAAIASPGIRSISVACYQLQCRECLFFLVLRRPYVRPILLR